jgi:predicted O-methyltransferase YrrM
VVSLPILPQSSLDVRPIDWVGLPRRFMNPGELEVLVALVRSVEPRHVIEFGVNVGRTAKAILANVVTVEDYTGIDVTPDYVPSKPVQRHEVPARPGELVTSDPRFRLIVTPRGSLDLAPGDLQPCDAAFIDGDHGREAVAHDTALAGAVIRPGGIIIWHDYHDLGTVDVKAVLDSYYRAGHAITHVAGTWLAFERIK